MKKARWSRRAPSHDRGDDDKRHTFFREAHHFDYLEKAYSLETSRMHIPQEATECASGPPAASSGEEAYSIAVTVLEAIPEAAEQDVLILATDIDRKCFAAAKQAFPGRIELGRCPGGI